MIPVLCRLVLVLVESRGGDLLELESVSSHFIKDSGQTVYKVLVVFITVENFETRQNVFVFLINETI